MEIGRNCLSIIITIISNITLLVSHNTAVTLLFEHLPSRGSEIQYFEIFSHLWENQLAQLFFAKISLQKQIFIKLQNDCDPYIEICLLSNDFFFFDNFINHFQKIHKSILHKITIDLLYFWDVYYINLWENIFCRSTAYSCRTNAFI